MELRRDAETHLTRLRALERERELERERRLELMSASPPRRARDGRAAGTAVIASPPPSSHEPRTEAEDTRPAGVRWPTLVVAGGALASALGAVATGWLAHAKYNDLAERCPEGACTDQWTDERAQGQRLARTSSALTVSAVALGCASVALWIVDLRRPDRRARANEPRASARAQARSECARRRPPTRRPFASTSEGLMHVWTALLALIALSGCHLIDDFGRFHQASDGGPDGGRAGRRWLRSTTPSQ